MYGETYNPEHSSCNHLIFYVVIRIRAFMWDLYDYGGQEAPNFWIK
jgi:hypothetical protein